MSSLRPEASSSDHNGRKGAAVVPLGLDNFGKAVLDDGIVTLPCTAHQIIEPAQASEPEINWPTAL